MATRRLLRLLVGATAAVSLSIGTIAVEAYTAGTMAGTSCSKVVLDGLGSVSHCANAAAEAVASRGCGRVAKARWKVTACRWRRTVLEECVLGGVAHQCSRELISTQAVRGSACYCLRSVHRISVG